MADDPRHKRPDAPPHPSDADLADAIGRLTFGATQRQIARLMRTPEGRQHLAEARARRRRWTRGK